MDAYNSITFLNYRWQNRYYSMSTVTVYACTSTGILVIATVEVCIQWVTTYSRAGFPQHWSVLVKDSPVANSKLSPLAQIYHHSPAAVVHYNWLHNLMVILWARLTTNLIVTTVYNIVTTRTTRL